jgi:hypothetical protein
MASGRRLPYALDKTAYGGRHGTQGTVPARRGDIGEDAGDKRSPAQGRFSQPVQNYEAV